MKAMNFESTKWRRPTLEGEVLDEATLDRRRKRRLMIIGGVVLGLIVAVAVFFAFFSGSDEKAAGA